MGSKKLMTALMAPLTPLDRVIPKNKRLILIYSNLGLRDNTKAMLDWLIEHEYTKRYEIVVACEGHRTFRRYAPLGVKFISCRRALFTFLRCRVMFYSFGKFPIKPSPRQTVVNLWHGMPLKTFASMEKGVRFDGRCYFSYVIATSPFFGEIMRKCFECRAEQVVLTGQPRDDKLINSGKGKKRLILWLPTYRRSARLSSENGSAGSETGLPIAYTSGDLSRLDELLERENMKLFVKLHPMEDASTLPNTCRNIVFIDEYMLLHREADIYDLMKVSCALITDYSSVSFDYLLLDRPIGYTLDDIDSYTEQRGFTVEDPLKLMPGDRIQDMDGLCRFISDVSHCRDTHRDERRRVNMRVNASQDGHACEKIAKLAGLN